MSLYVINTAKKILSEHIKIDINNIANPCNLYNADTGKLTAVYLYDINEAPDHYFGYKVCYKNITDYYILRSEHAGLQNNANKILQQHPGYHCVEYDPETDKVISKYKFNHTNSVTEEVKYSVDNIELQRNYLCSYKHVPKVYYNDNINIDTITGYSCKKGVKYLLVKGLEYGILK